MNTTLRIALLHLAPVPGEVERNRQLIERGIGLAAERGATWVLTPELAVSGYGFAARIGTDWIEPQPDAWMHRMGRLAAHHRLTLFLSVPERDADTTRLHNALFVIGPQGTVLGVHRKINALRVGSEAWSTPGQTATPIAVAPFARVGLLICADAYSPHIAASLHTQGAQILVSAAAWAPGLHGPQGEWERCTRDTGLPLIVCNRTGLDTTLDFTQAESVVAQDGRRRLSLTAARSTMFLIDWNLANRTLASTAYERIVL